MRQRKGFSSLPPRARVDHSRPKAVVELEQRLKKLNAMKRKTRADYALLGFPTPLTREILSQMFKMAWASGLKY